MAYTALISGNNVFKSGNYILQTTDTVTPPIILIKPSLWTGFTDNQPISGLLNSANGEVWNQPTATAQAKYLVNQLNGKPAVYFDGGDFYDFPYTYSVASLLILAKFNGSLTNTHAMLGPHFVSTNTNIGGPYFSDSNRGYYNGTKVALSSLLKTSFYSCFFIDLTIGAQGQTSISKALINSVLYYSNMHVLELHAYNYRLTESDRNKIIDDVKLEYAL